MIHNCQEPGCTNSGSECFFPDSVKPDHYYCCSHAYKHGFCYGCGEFYGGIEQFEFPRASFPGGDLQEALLHEFWGNLEGFCPNCSGEIEEEWREADDDVDFEEWEVYG